jgi:glycosyltransferase involved in cell wall biosynthesis
MVKKQICLVITKSNFGGAQKYVYEIATSLDKEIFDVTVALGGEGILKQKLLEADIKVISIPNLERDISLFKEFSVFKFLYNFFNEKHFDVVHLNSSKIGGIGSLAARLAGVPKIIFTAHGWAFNEDRSFISKILIKLSYWITIMISDKIIAVSNQIKSQIIGWPFVSNKISVIHNGVKEIDFYEKENSREKIAQINSKVDKNKFLIGTIAELHQIKGLDILIESAKEVTKNENVQFVIIGEGHERENLEKKIKLNKLENSVILLGFLDNAAKYLKAFDLFVLPSRSEALALVIIESGLANIPVIASKVGGLPEIISDKKYGTLFAKENYIELSNEIKYSIENYEETKITAKNLNQRIKENFSYQNMLEETSKNYL